MTSSKKTRHSGSGQQLEQHIHHANSNTSSNKHYLLPALLILTSSCGLGLFGGRPPALARAQSISIQPADFDRLIMPCYLGGQQHLSPSAGSAYQTGRDLGGQQQQLQQPAAGYPPSQSLNAMAGSSSQQRDPMGGRLSPPNGNQQQQQQLGLQQQQQASYMGTSPAAQFRDLVGGQGQGQAIPRALTIDNFIALVSKVEAANPRLANNLDQFVRLLLSRFRLDNYYYDLRSRTPISEPDRRFSDILPALNLGGAAGGGPYGQQQQQQYGGADYLAFPEQSLDGAEKCSMYFMLSHFVDKTTPLSPGLASTPVSQLAGPQYGQRPPSLQAAGAGYPAQSASLAFGSGGARYPGPSPSFGSPATSNMNAFGTGISSQPEYSGRNGPYGVNVAQPANQYNQPSVAGFRQSQQQGSAQYSSSQARPVAPYLDAGGAASRSRDERVAIEYGVVGVPNQDNAAVVLNRVLLGLLAASTQPQTLRQLAALVYPTQQLMTNTPKMDDELDPLYAVTLADLWAVSAIPKAGKPFGDVRLLGDNGRWNDTMCPTTFTLDRPSSIRFTTAELLGGIDGFILGLFRKQLASRQQAGRNGAGTMRLSELLRLYYSRNGFRPQFPEFGVCNRQLAFNLNQDELRRQAENYLRLYQFALPLSDHEIAAQIQRLDAFREVARQAASQYAPQELCQEAAYSAGGGGGPLDANSAYPMAGGGGGAEACELPRVDLVAVLDSSPQANDPFMQLVVAKLAQRLGLGREGSSISVLTNQQDSSGYSPAGGGGGGGYSFNAILRNSTNTAEIGCALVHDNSQMYQGGQITDATRLMEMFERALVGLDTEYLVRQQQQQLGGGSGSTSYASSSSYSNSYYRSSWFDGVSGYMPSAGQGQQGGPRNTGGAKVILWFNYAGQLARPASVAGAPTNWYGSSSSSSSSGYYDDQQGGQQYKFFEAKKYLKENFRGASILAVAASRDDVKSFVYDDERDIFTDGIPPAGNGGGPLISASSSDFYPSSQGADPASYAMLAGPADQLVGKLLQRMCTIPALFQYPMCFRAPSDNVASVGYISPGRRQYWMMAPKSYFASRSVRLAFRVEGGRLRVCFGRKPNPDETFLRYSQQQGLSYQSGISFGSGQPIGSSSGSGFATNQQQQQQQQQPSTPAPQATSGDYYTGMDYGVCKDVAAGQEIDFMVADPCYKKSIAECEPFYFVIRETSNPGEPLGDTNYMCRDPGCRRFDQAKFVMSHTGVTCSFCLKAAEANIYLIVASAAYALYMMGYGRGGGGGLGDDSVEPDDGARQTVENEPKPAAGRRTSTTMSMILLNFVALGSFAIYTVGYVEAQQGNLYDFGQNRYGEKRGSYTPYDVLAIILVVMVILAALALTLGLCYYVLKREKRDGMQPVSQEGY